jgi:hypothetical protein
MGPLFAKMDINLDSHPKIRKAGRDGREVFLFVLRKNAALGRGGKIPVSYVDPDYLAEQLMVTVSEARSGLSRCVTADLLFVTGLEVEISGWDDDWGGRPMSDAERKAKQRKKSKKADTSDTESRDVTNGHEVDRDDRDSHVEEKRREEKKRENGAAALDPTVPEKPDRATAIADLAIGEINRLAKTRYEPTSESAVDLARKLAKSRRTDDEILLVIRSKKSWVGDGKMHQHFTPSTLLGPKNFAKYLDEARGSAPVRAGPLLVVSSDIEPDPQGAMRLT